MIPVYRKSKQKFKYIYQRSVILQLLSNRFTNESNDVQQEGDDLDEILLNRNSNYRLKPYAKHL